MTIIHPFVTDPILSMSRPISSKALYVETYGCQMNKSDSELIVGLLARDGYRLVDDVSRADVILVNTCAIREHAETRVLGRMAELNHLKGSNPDLILGLCGCMSQHLGEKILDKAPYIDLVVGPDGYRRLPEMIRSLDQRREPALNLALNKTEHYLDLDPAREPGINAWVTIMRGCNKFCTFCIVPYVRGRERSTPHQEIVRQVRRLADEGYREVTLLGQTVNAYQDGPVDFADLLQMVADVEGIERVRFTSPHPSHFSERLIEVMADHPRICKHTHLPVQSGSTRILQAMRRDYTADEYRALVDRLRSRISGLALTTDVIVGFCGETDEDFQATYDLMTEIRYDAAFMFKYSPRDGTVAYRRLHDDVPEEEKSRRLTAIIDLQKAISEEHNRAYVGRTVEVLVEGESKRDADYLFGKTGTFKTVVFPKTAGVQSHALVAVHIIRATAFTLFGDVERIESRRQ